VVPTYDNALKKLKIYKNISSVKMRITIIKYTISDFLWPRSFKELGINYPYELCDYEKFQEGPFVIGSANLFNVTRCSIWI
jgi:hypothetical protein